MRTVLVGARPPEFDAWLERRRALDQDRLDEVWEGEYHVAPYAHGRHGAVENELAVVLRPYARRAGLRGSAGCNIGIKDDFRVPDMSFFEPGPTRLWNPTAAIVVEVVSPGDESRAKYTFYHRAGVEEVLIVDPEARTVEVFVRLGEGFGDAGASPRLGVSAADLQAAIGWPD